MLHGKWLKTHEIVLKSESERTQPWLIIRPGDHEKIMLLKIISEYRILHNKNLKPDFNVKPTFRTKLFWMKHKHKYKNMNINLDLFLYEFKFAPTSVSFRSLKHSLYMKCWWSSFHESEKRIIRLQCWSPLWSSSYSRVSQACKNNCQEQRRSFFGTLFFQIRKNDGWRSNAAQLSLRFTFS